MRNGDDRIDELLGVLVRLGAPSAALGRLRIAHQFLRTGVPPTPFERRSAPRDGPIVDDPVEMWLDADTLIDDLWECCLGTDAGRDLAGTMLETAATGPLRPVADFLARDALRMAAVDRGRDGALRQAEPFRAVELVEVVLDRMTDLGVTTSTFLDVLDLHARGETALTVGSLRVIGGKVRTDARSFRGVRSLLLRVSTIYDRQLMIVDQTRGPAARGTELLTSLPCHLGPSGEIGLSWRLLLGNQR
jgi:hypothetical protein